MPEGRVFQAGARRIYAEGPFEEISKRSDGKTERRVISYRFHITGIKKPARIDLWRAPNDDSTLEIGFHSLTEKYRGLGPALFKFIHNDPYLRQFGVEKITITKDIARDLSFFAHMGYEHATEREKEGFRRALSGQWPTGIERTRSTRLGSILFRYSQGRRKTPKTTMARHLA